MGGGRINLELPTNDRRPLKVGGWSFGGGGFGHCRTPSHCPPIRETTDHQRPPTINRQTVSGRTCRLCRWFRWRSVVGGWVVLLCHCWRSVVVSVGGLAMTTNDRPRIHRRLHRRPVAVGGRLGGGGRWWSSGGRRSVVGNLSAVGGRSSIVGRRSVAVGGWWATGRRSVGGWSLSAVGGVGEWSVGGHWWVGGWLARDRHTSTVRLSHRKYFLKNFYNTSVIPTHPSSTHSSTKY